MAAPGPGGGPYLSLAVLGCQPSGSLDGFFLLVSYRPLASSRSPTKKRQNSYAFDSSGRSTCTTSLEQSVRAATIAQYVTRSSRNHCAAPLPNATEQHW